MFELESKEPLIWWKDLKLFIGIVLFILNFAIGFYAKIMLIVKFNEPFYWWFWLGIYIFSWLLLFAGIFLMGLETYRIIKAKINHNVKTAVQKTYHHAKSLPRKGMELHRKSMSKIAATSKKIAREIK